MEIHNISAYNIEILNKLTEGKGDLK